VSGLVALLTDFGLTDHYVGVMKGVMLGIAPQLSFVDISHDVQPQNVRQGAFMLLNAYRYFPKGTVFLVVVDPGVGSARRPIVVNAGVYAFVAPDNGVLSYVLNELEGCAAYQLENPIYRLPKLSASFHGRDLFAPAAAHVAAGVQPSAFGRQVSDPVSLPAPRLVVESGQIEGEVLHIDRFGNLVTSIGRLERSADELLLVPWLGDRAARTIISTQAARIFVNGQQIVGIQKTYADVSPGELFAMVGSSGYLEIAVSQGNAAHRLAARLGDTVIMKLG
jgi:S-adenosylmethionine hydrolase